MTWPEVWLIVGMTFVTYACRYPVLALVSRVTLPPPVVAALRFVPPAVLAAIIAPAVLAPAGTWAITLANPAVFAALVSSWMAWRRQNLLLTIVAGMAAWWVWQLGLMLF